MNLMPIKMNVKFLREFLQMKTGVMIILICLVLQTEQALPLWKFSIEMVVIFTKKDNYRDEFIGNSDNGNSLVTGAYFYEITFETEDAEYGLNKNGVLYINVEK